MEPYIGEIRWVGFNFAPSGWAFCTGSLMSIAQNQALFSLLGTTYGGDGQVTFALPDLRGTAALGMGTLPGLPVVELGQRGQLMQPPSGAAATAGTLGLNAIIALEGIFPQQW